MTVTQQAISELERALTALRAYRDSGIDTPNPLHAAAVRASMDATKALSMFRRTGQWANRQDAPR